MRLQDIKTQQPAVETEPIPKEVESYVDMRPNGEAMAALVAAGIGVALLGFFTTIVEFSKPIKDSAYFR